MKGNHDQDVFVTDGDASLPAADLLGAMTNPVALFNSDGSVHAFSQACKDIFSSDSDEDCRDKLQRFFTRSNDQSSSNWSLNASELPDADFQSVGQSDFTLATFIPCDPITKLLTRPRLVKLIDSSLKHCEKSSLKVVLIKLHELNEFKAEAGESASNRLLQKVAKRLSDVMPKEWLIASDGASSFSILATEIKDDAVTDRFEKTINKAKDILGRPYLIDQEVAELKAHIGWTSCIDEHSTLELLRQAELSLAVNMHSLSGMDRPYSADMDEKRREERKLEFDLRKAILLNEFELHYQMQLDYTNRKISGFEALIRWRHPELGLIFPDVFIPLAEKSGLIVAIGEWVIKTACHQALSWPEDIRVAVNVSPVQLQSENLISVVQASLSNSGLSPDRLEIEITESTAIQDETSSRNCLLALKDLGVSIALDDFGTGYASLSYLRSFPFDKLKIDQSFVRSEENRVQNDLVLQSMFTLGKCFGMTTLAEGIETEEHQEKILGLGCDKAQGYLYSRPIPFEDTFSLIEEFNHVCFTTPSTAAVYERHETIVKSTEGALFQIAYISDNASDSSPEQLSLMMEDIQLASKRKNTEDNISGALMFNQQCFAQILEGESEVIEATFERIQSDPRHHNVQVLDFGPIEQRSFPEWAMAFVGETKENSSQFSQLSLIHAKSSEDNQGLKLQRLLLQLVENSTSTLKAA